MKTAEEWYQQALHHLDLSRGADSTREYRSDLESACDALAQCLALDTGHRAALRERGLTLAQLEHHTDALDCLVAYAAQVPDDEAVLFEAAQCTAALQQPGHAVPLFEAVRKLAPARTDVAFGLAQALLDSGEAKRSIPHFEHALTDHDRNGLGEGRLLRAALGLGVALARLDDVRAQEALHDAFKRALKDLPHAPAGLFDALRTHEVARWALRRLETDHPLVPRNFRKLALTWERAGFEDDARRLRSLARTAREALVAQHPLSASAWLEKAEDHLGDGEHELAFAAFERSAELDPPGQRSLAAARLEYERGRYEQGPWKLMGRDTFAREDFAVATFATLAEAKEALATREQRAASSTADESLRDEYWLVKG